MTARPAPPDLGMVLRTMRGWAAELRTACAEPDPEKQGRMLGHLEKNIQGAINVLEYYLGDGNNPPQ